jgi:Tol biopolymer transport system component
MVRIGLAVSLAALAVVGAANADAQRAEVVSVAVDGSRPLTLATAPDAFESPTFSPDGRTVAFVHDGHTVEVVAADGTGTRSLDEIVTSAYYAAVLTARWAPNGKTVVASASGYPTGGDPRIAVSQLFTFDVTTGALISRHPGRYASFSRDGRYIAYQTHSSASLSAGGDTIGVCRPDGSHDTPLGRGSYAAWSPVADRVAYVTRPGYLTVAGPSGQARWTLRAMKAGPIAWFPDGKAIAVVHAAARPALFLVSPGSQRVRRLVDLPTAPGAASPVVSVSHDGRWVAVSYEKLTFVVRRNGSGLEVLPASAAAWSPRATALAFVTGNRLSLWKPGAGRSIVYSGRALLTEPSWSPDGTRVVLVDNE